MNRIEYLFESALWQIRLVVLVAVIASAIAAVAIFYMATVDAFYTVLHLVDYASPSLAAEARQALHASTVVHVVEVIDGYLLGAVLLIFALGLYELFISKLDPAHASETSSNVLVIRSLDDLKTRLGKVILMILIVNFFQHATGLTFEEPLHLLYLAAGIALVGVALYLTHADRH